jgi:hypothetical protein
VVRIRYVRLGPLRHWFVSPHPKAGRNEIEDARRVLRLGQRPQRLAPTRPSEAPPAPVPG